MFDSLWAGAKFTSELVGSVYEAFIIPIRIYTAHTAHALCMIFIALLIIIYGSVDFKREFMNKCPVVVRHLTLLCSSIDCVSLVTLVSMTEQGLDWVVFHPCPSE